MSETNVGPIVEELAALRGLLEHSLSVLQPPQNKTLAIYPELQKLLEDAMERTRADARRVWYRTWHGFDSRIAVETAVLVGGLYSPGFVSLGKVSDYYADIPYVCHFEKARLLLASSIQGTVTSWIELLEAVATSNESLVIITPEFESSEILDTLVVNKLRGTLNVCAVHPSESLPSIHKLAASLPTSDGKPAPVLESEQTPSTGLLKSLPIATILARRDATVLTFEEIRNVPSAALDEILWIDVGGNDALDQRNRLLALAQAVVENITREINTEVVT